MIHRHIALVIHKLWKHLVVLGVVVALMDGWNARCRAVVKEVLQLLVVAMRGAGLDSSCCGEIDC